MARRTGEGERESQEVGRGQNGLRLPHLLPSLSHVAWQSSRFRQRKVCKEPLLAPGKDKVVSKKRARQAEGGGGEGRGCGRGGWEGGRENQLMRGGEEFSG